MTSYIVKRVIMAVITLFFISTITFFLMNVIPGGPFMAEKAPSQATMDALNEKYGLDKPLIVQYKNYMTKLVQGDLGVSLKQRGRTVNGIIASKFPVSARLGGLAALVALAVGVPLGCITALFRGKWLDQLLTVTSTLGIAVPTFVAGTILMYVFGVNLGWLPTMGLATPLHYILPVITLSLYPCAYITRLMRSSMLDVLGQDYMRTARAKGLSRGKMLFKHALRNAILPVITYVGPMLAYTMVGSMVVENLFTIPGLGSDFIAAITNRDYPLIMGTTIFLAALIIAMNTLVDIIYQLVDPRIKLK